MSTCRHDDVTKSGTYIFPFIQHWNTPAGVYMYIKIGKIQQEKGRQIGKQTFCWLLQRYENPSEVASQSPTPHPRRGSQEQVMLAIGTLVKLWLAFRPTVDNNCSRKKRSYKRTDQGGKLRSHEISLHQAFSLTPDCVSTPDA